MIHMFNGDFARLISRNQIAQKLFFAARVYVDEHHIFHMRFVRSNIEAMSFEFVESSTKYDNLKKVKQLRTDCFVLSFNEKRESEFLKLGWRVGKETKKIKKTHDVNFSLFFSFNFLSESFARMHLMLRFNSRSKLLMLRKNSAKTQIECRTGNEWISLNDEKKFFIFEILIRIKTETCEYDLKHIVSAEKRKLYFCARDKLFVKKSNEIMSMLLKKMSGDKYIFKKQYLELETQESKTFDWIIQGLDTKTDDSIVIKKMRINKNNKIEMITKMKIKTYFTVCDDQFVVCDIFDKNRTSLIFFRFLTQCASTVVPKSAVTWRNFIWLCFSQFMISQKIFENVKKFRFQLKCNYSKSLSKVSNFCMSWKSFTATSNLKTCSLCFTILLALRCAITTKQLKQKKSQIRKLIQFIRWRLKYESRSKMIFTQQISMREFTIMQLQKFWIINFRIISKSRENDFHQFSQN